MKGIRQDDTPQSESFFFILFQMVALRIRRGNWYHVFTTCSFLIRARVSASEKRIQSMFITPVLFKVFRNREFQITFIHQKDASITHFACSAINVRRVAEKEKEKQYISERYSLVF